MKVRYILMGLIMYLLMGVDVDAATLSEDEEIGTNTYIVDYCGATRKMSKPSGYWKAVKVNGSITTAGFKVCIVRTEHIVIDETIDDDIYYGFDYYIYNSNGYEKVSLKSSCFSRSGTSEDGLYNGTWTENYDNIPHNTYNTMTAASSYSSNYVYDSLSWSYFKSSAPIFASEEQAIAFMTGDGTVTEKDAVNYESDIAKVVYDLEVPLKLHTTVIEGDGVNFGLLGFYDELTLPQLLFKWEQSDPNYVNWETEFYCYEDFKYREYILIIGMSPWKNVDNFFLYRDSVECYKLTWNNMMKCTLKGWDKREEQYPTDTQGEYVPLKQTFYIRNAFYDSENGVRHYSNWVKAEYDLSLGELKVSYVELEGSDVEIDSDSGNVSIKDSDVVVDSDSGYTGQQNEGVSSQNSSDLLGFINNGFGLLGDNGLISLLSETFSFVPSELWGILLAGISIMVLIAIAKLVF